MPLEPVPADPGWDDDPARHAAEPEAPWWRPADEYRPVTDAEWNEFRGHFARRKVAPGDCGRAYGTPCAHENAC